MDRTSDLRWSLALLLAGWCCTCTLAHSMGDIQYADDDGVGGDFQDMHMADWNKDWAMLSGRMQQPNCVDIPANMTLCHGISYTQMRLPNLLEHDTLREATSQAAVWTHLLGIRCHPDTQIFLCSLFSPVCLERPIYPCRSLCQAVQSGCEGYMRKYKYPWPEMLRCDKFPVDNDLCITKVNRDAPPDDRTCQPCSQPDTFEGIVDNFCSAEFALKLKVEEKVVVGRDYRLTAAKKKKAYKKGSLKRSELRKVVAWLEGGAGCDCGVLDQAGDQDLLVMGHKKSDRLVVTFLQSFDRKSPALRKALRAIRKEDICKVGLPALTHTMDGGNAGNKASPGKGDDKRRDGKRGRKNRKDKDKKKSKKRKSKRRKKGGRKGRKSRPDRERGSSQTAQENAPSRQ